MNKSGRRMAGIVVVVLAVIATLVAILANRGDESGAAPPDASSTTSPSTDEPAIPLALEAAWEAQLPAGKARIVRATDRVVVVAGDTYLIGFERSSGDEIWRHEAVRSCAASGVASTGVVVVATGKPALTSKQEKPCAALTAYDVNSGQQLWRAKVPPFVLNPDVDALAVGNKVVTAVGRCSAVRLRIKDGRELSRTEFERDDLGDCFYADAATDGEVLVEFTPDDTLALDVTGTLRVSDTDTGKVLFEQQGESPVALPVLSSSPLVLGLFPAAQRITREGGSGRVLVEADDSPQPVRRAPGSTYALNHVDEFDGTAIVHRFDTTTGSRVWSRALSGDVVAADRAGLTVVSGAQDEPYDVVRLAARDGQRQLLGRIARDDGTSGQVLGDGDALVAVGVSEKGEASVRMFQLPPAGEYAGLRDDGRGVAGLGPDDAIGACDGFSDQTFALLGGRRTKVGLRLDCDWYAVSTFDLNVQFETDVSIGTPDWAEQEARSLDSSQSLNDFKNLRKAVRTDGWGDQAWVLEDLGPGRDLPQHRAPTKDNVVYGAVVRVGEVSVKVLASVEVEKPGAQGVPPAGRVRRAVERAVAEIFASLDVVVTRR